MRRGKVDGCRKGDGVWSRWWWLLTMDVLGHAAIAFSMLTLCTFDPQVWQMKGAASGAIPSATLVSSLV